jgi:hypothetical protein
MTLPHEFYCGFKRGYGSDYPLGFITPTGTDKASQKRIGTVDNWRSKDIDPITFPNDPVSGFKVSRSVKRTGWNGGNVVIRVEDPRGFELEISVANFLKLIENNTLENGEIMAECVWGRDGGANYLLATNSDPYIQAVANTERKSKKVSTKDVKPGYKVKLQNGDEFRLLGTFHTLTWMSGYRDPNGTEYKSKYSDYGTEVYGSRLTPTPKRSFFLRDNGDVVTIATPKIAEVLETDEMTVQEVHTTIQNAIVEGLKDNNYNHIVGFSDSAMSPDDFTLELVPHKNNEESNRRVLANGSTYWSGYLMYDISGVLHRYYVSYSDLQMYGNKLVRDTMTVVNMTKWAEKILEEEIVIKPSWGGKNHVDSKNVRISAHPGEDCFVLKIKWTNPVTNEEILTLV